MSVRKPSHSEQVNSDCAGRKRQVEARGKPEARRPKAERNPKAKAEAESPEADAGGNCAEIDEVLGFGWAQDISRIVWSAPRLADAFRWLRQDARRDQAARIPNTS